MADISHIKRLNNWEKDEISGLEIYVDDFDNIDNYQFQLSDEIASQVQEDGSRIRVTSIKSRFPHIFDWLNLLDMNVIIIIILMIIVAIINMISGLLILILDRTTFIGILKTLGCNNMKIREVFLYQSLFLITKGLAIGNLTAITLCVLQDRFELIKLNKASYFIDFVPINLSIWSIIEINIASLAIIMFSMLLPTMLISKIDPVKILRFT